MVNDFYNIITKFDFLSHIKITTVPEKHIKDFKDYEYNFEGYIDDVPFKFIDGHEFRLSTAEEIDIISGGNVTGPITVEYYTNEHGVVIPFIDVILIERDINKEEKIPF